MKEEQFTLEEQVFRFEKEETSWRLDLKRSEVDAIYGFWISIILCFWSKA